MVAACYLVDEDFFIFLPKQKNMPKKPVYILLLILLSLSYSCRTSRKLTTSSERHPSVTPVGQLADDYIRNYKDIAISEMKRTGIPASITLAQGMVESDYGRSSLARRANNHFGIKCHDDWKGPVVNENDDSDNECFRKYSSAENSFYDHSDFLKTRPRYNFLFDIATSDYKAWAYGLKKSGYATNPDYANMIIKSIEDNNLMVFDIPGKNGKTTDSGKKHQSQGTLTAGTQVIASTRKLPLCQSHQQVLPMILLQLIP